MSARPNRPLPDFRIIGRLPHELPLLPYSSHACQCRRERGCPSLSGAWLAGQGCLFLFRRPTLPGVRFALLLSPLICWRMHMGGGVSRLPD